MPTFSYIAKSKDGQEKSGLIEAASKSELARSLRQEGYFLTSVSLAEAEGTRIRQWKRFFRIWSRISLLEKMNFARHLATMIKAGLPLNRSLQILAKQTKNSQFAKIITEIEENVRKGQSFSDSLGKYPRVFSELFVNMVKVGETSGNLEEVLKILGSQMAKDHELRSRIKGAMIYPAVIVCAMVGIGILMMIMVVPKLSAVFEELKIDLPWTTKLVIFTGQFLSSYFISVLIGLLIMIILIRQLVKTKIGRKIIDLISLNLPILGRLTRQINSAYFARNFSSLIEAGVPIVNALQIVAKTITNSFFRQSLFISAERVQKGEALSKILENFSQLYPIMVIQMIEVGETTGTLSNILENLAGFYEEEVTNATKNLSSIIEPILMIIIGAAVGFFAISMIQPLYSMMSGI